VLPLPAPRLSIDQSAPPSATRTVRLTIAADAAVRCLELWHETGPALTTVSINGRATRRFVRFSPELEARLLRLLSADQNRPGWHLRHCAARGNPVTIDVAIAGTEPAVLHLVEERSGLPDEPRLLPREPPPSALQASDVTLCARLIRL
jgi:hypothetical protein